MMSILFSLAVFTLSGLTEIGGGWLIWKVVRENWNWLWLVLGGSILVAYGFVATLQPSGNFGRVYAAYGGLFIVFSLLWGWLVDKNQPDIWDLVGGLICLGGAAIIIYAPRAI